MATLSDNFKPQTVIFKSKFGQSMVFPRLVLLFCFALVVLAGCGFQNEFTITVSPASSTIGLNKTQQFFATAIDLQDSTLSKSISWGVSGSIGTIDANGMFYAGSVTGSGYVLASSEGVTGQASVTITDKGAISGRLRNVLGTNLSSISIVFTGGSVLTTSTNSLGNYSISNVSYGTYEAAAQENVLYLSATGEVFVVTGETSTLNMVLPDRLSIEDENISGDPKSISGTVVNHGATDATGVFISYSFFDEESTLIGAASQNLGTISTGDSRAFTLVPSPIVSSYSTFSKTVSATSFR